jgi:hypothetical protein
MLGKIDEDRAFLQRFFFQMKYHFIYQSGLTATALGYGALK